MNTDKIFKILKMHELWSDTNGVEGERANLEGAYLIGANLEGADLRLANLRGAYLIGTNLEGANLSEAYLNEADLSEANLRGANLRGAYLIGANLEGADLSETNLGGSYLRGANLLEIKGKDILTFSFNQHQAIYVDGELRIGCEVHSLDNWLENYKDIGKRAGYSVQEVTSYGLFIKHIKELGV